MTASPLIDTDSFSKRLRAKSIDVTNRRILIADFRSTEQENDLTVPPNCGGYGRVRHFTRETSPGWPQNPLPIDPARRALGLPVADEIEAQVFQNAACNWRCWYCYVPFDLLAAHQERGAWFTAAELVQRYLEEENPPPMIDLTGGQPDLVPEWIPWMMEAIQERGLERPPFLWSDDNLSNDYYFRFLSVETRKFVGNYRGYGRVCCFKGFDSDSFSFNTRAAPELFQRQFALFRRLLEEGLDLYAYVTFTTAVRRDFAEVIPRFVDQLQSVHENLPLRTVPLEIQEYTPMAARMRSVHRDALALQWEACEAWQKEIEMRFSSAERTKSVVDVSLSAEH